MCQSHYLSGRIMRPLGKKRPIFLSGGGNTILCWWFRPIKLKQYLLRAQEALATTKFVSFRNLIQTGFPSSMPSFSYGSPSLRVLVKDGL